MKNKHSNIDEVLPKAENEVIRVIGYSNHFRFFVDLLSDYLHKDLRKNYRLIGYHADLWGLNKVVVLNGAKGMDYKMYRELHRMERMERKVIRVWDGGLEDEIKQKRNENQ